MLISMTAARHKLAIVWFSGAGLTFAALLIITTLGNNGHGPVLWDWFLPAVTPNLSLIVGVLVSDLRNKATQGESVESFMYHLALWLSIAYLLLLFITPLLSPFTNAALDVDLQNSKLPLSLVQALATTALGAFYVQRESKS
ncbi:hypothetical protein [Sulfurirhabdus autotrophica]|uniref:Uncharacterized protein n=1 Tax=Sulfurirhabdus autotrophica TaxID=1706046 RepID=A0A4R3YEV8_9PROT|nr:hypothetical protein [Sulfurirhabdus autotrophica]TCV90620.1 hypothetical protein EDC63_101594 [Sulfurirhabdus autotrophica]